MWYNAHDGQNVGESGLSRAGKDTGIAVSVRNERHRSFEVSSGSSPLCHSVAVAVAVAVAVVELEVAAYAEDAADPPRRAAL